MTAMGVRREASPQELSDSYARLYGVKRSAYAPDSPEEPSPSFSSYDDDQYDMYDDNHYDAPDDRYDAYTEEPDYYQHQQYDRPLYDRKGAKGGKGDVARPTGLSLHVPGSNAPRVPSIRGGKENDFDDDEGLLSPRRVMQGVNDFSAMCSAGAGWGSAMVSVLQGHKMTEEQAAICVQSHWRRHEAVVGVIARALAAEHIQNTFRERQYVREDAALIREEAERERDEREYWRAQTYMSATVIAAAWRGYLARIYVRSISKKKRGSIARSFSFGKKRTSAASKPAPKAVEKAEKAAEVATPRQSTSKEAGDTSSPKGGGGGLAKVRRSLSFGSRKSKSSSGTAGGATKSFDAPSTSAVRRTFVLERGEKGLGLELDATNTVVTIKEGGRAERQGLLCLGDTILTIDGKSCAGKLMQDVMVPGRPVYVAEVSRPERSSLPAAKPANIIKRSLSFDTKHRGGGVKRTFSFGSKR